MRASCPLSRMACTAVRGETLLWALLWASHRIVLHSRQHRGVCLLGGGMAGPGAATPLAHLDLLQAML